MNCSQLDLFAKCGCLSGILCSYCFRLTAVVAAITLGAIIAWKPRKTIDIQIAFYRLINWKVEPISMPMEIRNTRIMGLTLLVFGVASFIYLWLVL